jgi:chromosome segregation ATPase
VREALGNTGSPNTIHKHMSKWRAARPQAVAAAAELPAELIAALAGELTKAAATARGSIEGDLAQAQTEAAELASVGEALEQERDALLDQVSALTTERDQAQATSAERYSEIERQATVIAREQMAAENARIELAKAQLKIESVEERNREFHTEVLRLRDLLKEAEQGKQTAEQQAAVSAAQLAAEQAKSVDLTQRLSNAEKVAQEANQAAEAARRETNTARIAEQASQARLESAAREIESAKAQAKESRDEAKAAQSLAGELRGQLIAAQSKINPEV